MLHRKAVGIVVCDLGSVCKRERRVIGGQACPGLILEGSAEDNSALKRIHADVLRKTSTHFEGVISNGVFVQCAEALNGDGRKREKFGNREADLSEKVFRGACLHFNLDLAKGSCIGRITRNSWVLRQRRRAGRRRRRRRRGWRLRRRVRRRHGWPKRHRVAVWAHADFGVARDDSIVAAASRASEQKLPG